MPGAVPRILVAGAGLGGLCLAQGLRRAGVDVRVFERDPSADHRPQGYRIHFDARAAQALHRCLPPELYELFVATSSPPSRRVTIVDRQLHEMHVLRFEQPADPADPATFNASVDRMLVRQILLAELEDTVRFGAELVRYESGDGPVRAHFADGTSATGDLLVGADGINSPVRRQRLPAAALKDLGLGCVYGRTQIGAAEAALLPAAVTDGFVSVRAGRFGMALGLVRPREDPAVAAARWWPALRPVWAGDYLMWAMVVPAGDLPGGATRQELHDLVRERVTDWHPDLVALIDRAQTDQIFAVPIRSSSPVPEWPSSTVTLLGDAIHAMSPAQGSGANCALLDASVLSQELENAVAGGTPLVDAVHAYERRMTKYGFEAVRASERATASGGGLWGKLFDLLSHFHR
jgi:2-polyprenyl-6-methoxyphenol hydroxylase-like FAD-dependent oxidoreductase